MAYFAVSSEGNGVGHAVLTWSPGEISACSIDCNGQRVDWDWSRGSDPLRIDLWLGGLSGGAYLAQCLVIYRDGNIGRFSDNIVISGGGGIVNPPGNRPYNWYWSDHIQRGEAYNQYYDSNSKTLLAFMIQASEWNQFTYRINQFRVYKGQNQVYFTQVSQSDSFSANTINEAISQINQLTYAGIPSVYSGQNCNLSTFLQMSNALNSIN